MATSNKKVLIVEDDLDIRNSLASELSKVCLVYEAGDGEEAVAKVLDFRPDLVLLDLLLPKLDGYKVLERMRSYPDQAIVKIPVIVFSNLWSDKDILQAKALKIQEYFVKSNTQVKDVIKRVSQMLNE